MEENQIKGIERIEIKSDINLFLTFLVEASAVDHNDKYFETKTSEIEEYLKILHDEHIRE